MEELNEEFAEARYALADAEESVGTTYFADDLEDARDATEKVGAAAAPGSMTLSRHLAERAPPLAGPRALQGHAGVSAGGLRRADGAAQPPC